MLNPFCFFKDDELSKYYSILIHTLTSHFTFYQGLIQDAGRLRSLEVALYYVFVGTIFINIGAKKSI